MSALGKLGSADVPIATNQLLCTMDEAGIINILICNRNAANVNVSIAIGMGANPALADYIEYLVPMAGNQPMERTGISVSSGEKVWVYSDTANISARVHGVPAT